MTSKPNRKGPNARSRRTLTGKPGHRQQVQVARIGERQYEALKLRRAGCDYRTIAKRLGCSLETAYRYVQSALAATAAVTGEKAAEYRRLELERLDAAQVFLWPHVQTGEPKAIAALCRISERRCRLLGLDSPAKVALSGDVEVRPYKDLSREEVKTRFVSAVLQDPAMRAELASRLTIEASRTRGRSKS